MTAAGPGLEAYSPAGYGIQTLSPFMISAPRDPTSSDLVHPDGFPYSPGWTWRNSISGDIWLFVQTPGAPWLLQIDPTGNLATLSDDSSTSVSPSAGNIQIAGTADQVATTAGSSVLTISLIGPYTPATYTAHGVLIGEGTGSVVATTPGTTGQVLIGSTAADPAFGALGVNSGLTAHGVLLGENNSAIAATTAGSNGQVFLGSTSADPAFGTLTTSTGVNYTTGAHALAIDVISGGYKINAASTGVALVAQNSYTVTQAAQTSFSLPATAAVGDMFLIASGTGNTSGWIITQGASQEIWAGASHTTNGATGTLAGALHCSVVLMCAVANTDFIIVGGSGLTGLTFT